VRCLWSSSSGLYIWTDWLLQRVGSTPDRICVILGCSFPLGLGCRFRELAHVVGRKYIFTPIFHTNMNSKIDPLLRAAANFLQCRQFIGYPVCNCLVR
jgi:hypothetical protein